MLYVIYAQDNANSLENASRYGPRIWRLQLLHDEGRLLTAGACGQWHDRGWVCGWR
ncbi:hypothetical protein KCP70_25400 [Salmonella enterica subsp. enterica]|nr:hypothetical protein KCP70_25400 [Salmonella enterica subsp. enterica]